MTFKIQIKNINLQRQQSRQKK